MNEYESSVESQSPQWRPLDSLQRRVLGVLVEKAKTTPDSYPLTVNSIKTASNQKSNRKPQMDLDTDDVLATLDELREMGAVSEVQGDGRVSKYRHLAYKWLAVDKFELAVIAELLLRGEQTVGELRSRAARMEAIAGLTELRPILSSLRDKGLLIEVTPAGRGQVVTHNLYQEGGAPAKHSTSIPSREPSDVSRPEAQTESTGDSETQAKATTNASSNAPQADLEQRIEALEKRVKSLEELLAD